MTRLAVSVKGRKRIMMDASDVLYPICLLSFYVKIPASSILRP